MRNTTGFLLAGLVLAVSGTVQARETPVSVEGALDAYSQYIWRGFNLGDKLALQPSLTLGFNGTGVSLNVWGSASVLDREAPENLNQFDELDFTLSYDRTLSDESGVGISLGYIQYTFPSLEGGTKHSEEVYAGVSLDHVIAPSLTVYYDFGVADAFYLTAGIGPEIPLNAEGTASLNFGASIGLLAARQVEGVDENGFGDLSFTVGLSFTQGIFSFSPVLGYSYADDSVNADNGELWGGVSISFSR